MWTDSRFIYSEFTTARDIREAGIPDYGRIRTVRVLRVTIHSNRPSSLAAFVLRGFLAPGTRNAEQRAVGTAGWLRKVHVRFTTRTAQLALPSSWLLKGSLLHL